MKKQIADRRIYGTDAHGRRVLVAAPGQPIPEGFEVEGPTRVTRERKATPDETTTTAAQAEAAAEAEAKAKEKSSSSRKAKEKSSSSRKAK